MPSQKFVDICGERDGAELALVAAPIRRGGTLPNDHAFLGLGSNRGDRSGNLRSGLTALRAHGLEVVAVSSLYLTEPVLNGAVEGRTHPWYLNCVARIDAAPEATELLSACLDIENQHGRERGDLSDPTAAPPRPPQPRKLDIDLLLFGNQVIHGPDVTVPHPRLHERRFALLPLSELAPEVQHPTIGATIEELLRDAPDQGIWLLAPPPTPEAP